jgi:Tol biopolymer transport system component
MKIQFLILALLICVSTACAQNNSAKMQNALTPRLFAEGIINAAGDDYNPTFTADGKIVYFTRRKDRKGNESIMVSNLEKGKWSEPKIASFSGKFYDKEPFVSPDGKRIYFASMRPNGRDAKNNFDIWIVEKNANGWSEPVNLTEINSDGYDNYPAVAADGTLYFSSKRQGSREIDLYRSRFINGKYQTPENLGDIINTDATEADPYVSPDQSYIIFSSDRNGGEGEGDLYVSFNRNGSWTVPQSLGKTINTAEYEYTPLVSPDGKTFYFSRGWGDIYEIEFKALNLRALETNSKTR